MIIERGEKKSLIGIVLLLVLIGVGVGTILTQRVKATPYQDGIIELGNMKLHEKAQTKIYTVNGKDMSADVVRVASGWIYILRYVDSYELQPIFVPDMGGK